MYNNKHLAFQTVDREGDIWCNTALLFHNKEQAEEFFKNPEYVFKVLDFELSEGENYENISYELLYTNEEQKKGFYGLIFECDYGFCKILEMSKGFIISPSPLAKKANP